MGCEEFALVKIDNSKSAIGRCPAPESRFPNHVIQSPRLPKTKIKKYGTNPLSVRLHEDN